MLFRSGSPVVTDEAVYVYAQSGSGFTMTDGAIFALDRRTGSFLWGTDIGAPQLGSMSSPTYDAATNSILIGSGPDNKLWSLDAGTGAENWSTPLQKSIVNATAAVGGGKVFIGDYDGFGTASTLYAVNAATGVIDWQKPIGGASGATPAYADGRV